MPDNRKFVIFDLDGTIIDSYECVLRCVNKTLIELKLCLVKPENESIEELFKRVYATYNEISPKLFKELFDKEHMNDIQGINLISENYNLLRKFHNKGIQIIILTNKRQFIAERICKTFLSEINDSMLIIGRENLIPFKMFPNMVRDRISGRDISIRDCIGYYGDSDVDRELSNKLEIPFIKI